MAWVTPSTVQTGDVLTAAMWNQSVQANAVELAPLFSAWTSWTPAVTGNGLTITQGNATVTGSYIKIGRYVRFWARWVFGSTTSFGAGTASLFLSLPFTAASAPAAASGCVCSVVDSGTAHYPFLVTVGDSDTSRIVVTPILASGTYAIQGNVTATVPFTWAVNDTIWWAGTYEAAS